MTNRFIPPRANDPTTDASTGSAAGYEFNDRDNEIFLGLARVMKFVGIVSTIFGFLELFSGLNTGMNLEGMLTIGQGVALIAVGSWLASAAGSLRDIATSEGNDIGNLMIAMTRLRSVYTLQAWAMALACVLIGVGLVVALRH